MYARTAVISKPCSVTLIALALWGGSLPAVAGSAGQSDQQLFSASSSDGPVTICSDQLSYTQKQNHLTYSGNVVVLQIKDVNILCESKADTLPEVLSDTRPNYSMWVARAGKSYQQIQKSEEQLARKICARQKQCRFLAGQKLQVQLNQDNQVKKVSLTVEPDKGNVTHFYGASPGSPEQKKKDQQRHKKSHSSQRGQANSEIDETYARGEKMYFLPLQHKMVIAGKAHLKKGGNTFQGKKIIYDTESRVVSVPDEGHRASMIIDSQGNIAPGGKD